MKLEDKTICKKYLEGICEDCSGRNQSCDNYNPIGKTQESYRKGKLAYQLMILKQ